MKCNVHELFKYVGKLIVTFVLFVLIALNVDMEALASTYPHIDYSSKAGTYRIYQQRSEDCGIASVSSIEAYYQENTSGIYDTVYAKNGYGVYMNWSALGYESLSYSLPNLYNALKSGPCIIQRPGHYSVVVAYEGNTSTLEESGFKVMEIVGYYKYDGGYGHATDWLADYNDAIKVPLHIWKAAAGGSSLSSIVVRGNGVLGGGSSNTDGTRVKITGVTNLSNTSAQINATVSPGGNVTEIGFYYGTDSNNMQKVVESWSGYAESIWYQLGTGKWTSALQAGTTYYYQIYAVIGGVTYKSTVSSFTTTGAGINSEFPLINNAIYRIRNVNSGKVLEIPNASTASAVQLQQYDAHNGTNQQWKAIQAADGYSFIAVHSGKAMDVYGSSTSGGGKITQCNYHGGDNQRFKLVHRGDGKYSIHPVISGLAMDVYGYSLDNGALIYQYAYHGNANQLFTFELVDSEAPVISNVQVTDVTRDGYTVSCEVTDNIKVSRVCFPTWSDNNGQDDLKQDWYNNEAVLQPVSGNTYSYRVNAAEHNNEGGTYQTHIYAYDLNGNYTFAGTGALIDRRIYVTSVSFDYIGDFTAGNQIPVSNLSVLPTNADDRTVSWTSSNPSIISVDTNGTINLLKAGTATITGTTADGVSCSKQITVKESGKYIGNVNSELLRFTYNEANNYISGEIVVVEWVNGVSTVPSKKPIMTFDAIDGSESIEVFVTPTGTNTYYFDRLLGEGLTPGKEYIFNVSSGNELNVSEYATVPIYTGTSSIGAEGVLGTVNSQDICYKTDSGTGYLLVYGKSGIYEGNVNSVLSTVQCVTAENGNNFVSGNIVIVEWIDGVSNVPTTTPKMTFEAYDGTECLDVFMACLDGTNTYYFDRNLTEDMDVTKDYIFRITLTDERNVSAYKSMVATTNYMTEKSGVLWETATQIVMFKTVAADGDNQLRIYAVNK